MKQDPKKERQENVSGSSNRIYTEEVKITGERYTSKDFMEKELSKLWSKVWNIGGWSRELENQGDFITHHIGRESILMVKEKFIAWHAGKSRWKNFKNLNYCSIGM